MLKEASSHNNELTDEDLSQEHEIIRRVQAGDTEAWNDLARKYHPAMLRVARKKFGNLHLAEEIVQDAWVSIAQSIANFDFRGPFFGWALVIVQRRCIDELRRAGRRRERCLDNDDALDSLTHIPVDRRIVHREIRAQIEQAFQSIPLDDQSLLRAFIDGRSTEEMGEILHVKKGTVYANLHYARKHLREVLLNTLTAEDIEFLLRSAA